MLFLGAQRGEGLFEPGDFPEPGPLAGFGDALGEVVFEFAQQWQAAGFGTRDGADTGAGAGGRCCLPPRCGLCRIQRPGGTPGPAGTKVTSAGPPPRR